MLLSIHTIHKKRSKAKEGLQTTRDYESWYAWFNSEVQNDHQLACAYVDPKNQHQHGDEGWCYLRQEDLVMGHLFNLLTKPIRKPRKRSNTRTLVSTFSPCLREMLDVLPQLWKLLSVARICQ